MLRELLSLLKKLYNLQVKGVKSMFVWFDIFSKSSELFKVLMCSISAIYVFRIWYSITRSGGKKQLRYILTLFA